MMTLDFILSMKWVHFVRIFPNDLEKFALNHGVAREV